MIGADTTAAVTDFGALAKLRAEARGGDDKAGNIDQVAKQFESLFIHMVVKQMRQSSLGDGLFDSKQSQMYRDMYDQQLSSNLADKGGLGLAPAIRRQLGGAPLIQGVGRSHADYQAAPTRRPPAVAASQQSAPALQPATVRDRQGFAGPADFVNRLRPHAEAAAARLGVPAEALLAQAALESGWGKASMPSHGGGQSHNLFGIKADGRWSGDRASVQTLEYREGVAMKTRADFRAYDSYAESFHDYVDFITGNPRYRHALEVVDDPKAYFKALQDAGYATDPSYAKKVLSILDRPELQGGQLATASRPGEA